MTPECTPNDALTARGHWQIVMAATTHGGILDLVRQALRALIPVLQTIGAAPGMEHLCRTANTLAAAADALDSVAYLARLGCPKPHGRRVFIDPMETP